VVVEDGDIDTDILGSSAIDATKLKWEISSYGVFYEDSGEEKVRLIHKLQADIFAADEVTFEVAFRPKSLPAPTDTATIGEDYV